MKITSTILKKAHNMTVNFKKRFPEINYRVQLSLFLKEFMTEKKEKKDIKKEVRKSIETYINSIVGHNGNLYFDIEELQDKLYIDCNFKQRYLSVNRKESINTLMNDKNVYGYFERKL